jgi:uncharacterized membrane protein YeaQ/YmgE (transglycosylase-associated protein family)
MHEIVPIVLGAVFGTAAISMSLPGPRSGWFIAGCVLAGALASWMNGEVVNSLAPLFISFDALLAWCGALSSLVAVRAFKMYFSR